MPWPAASLTQETARRGPVPARAQRVSIFDLPPGDAPPAAPLDLAAAKEVPFDEPAYSLGGSEWLLFLWGAVNGSVPFDEPAYSLGGSEWL